VGEHEFSGRHGFICGPGEHIRGIASYQVQLEPGKLVTIPAANLVPRCVSNYLDGGVTKALTAVFCLKSDLTFVSGLGTTRGKSVESSLMMMIEMLPS
jgi:hypothetical protein